MMRILRGLGGEDAVSQVPLYFPYIEPNYLSWELEFPFAWVPCTSSNIEHFELVLSWFSLIPLSWDTLCVLPWLGLPVPVSTEPCKLASKSKFLLRWTQVSDSDPDCSKSRLWQMHLRGANFSKRRAGIYLICARNSSSLAFGKYQ